MDIKDIKDLILTIDKTSIEKVDIEKGDIKISISKSTGEKIERQITENIKTQPKIDEINEVKYEEDLTDIYIVKSPIVGAFYKSPSPDSEAFVKVGDKIENGQVLCIVEAMKMMNEIESEVSGEVMEILVDNEEIVEYDQPLIKIRR